MLPAAPETKVTEGRSLGWLSGPPAHTLPVLEDRGEGTGKCLFCFVLFVSELLCRTRFYKYEKRMEAIERG